MKLLLDENLSFRLVRALRDVFPGSAHLRDVGLVGSDDEKAWEFAGRNGFILTSKDADFYHRSVLRGAPPKVIWLRVGNASTDVIAKTLRVHQQVIQEFVEDQDATFLVLDRPVLSDEVQ